MEIASLSTATGGRKASVGSHSHFGKIKGWPRSLVGKVRVCCSFRIRLKIAMTDASHIVTVGSMLQSLKPGLMSPATTSLTDAADVMMYRGRTSVLVHDENGRTLGVITVNDLLSAFVEGVGFEAKVAKWLRAGDARLPGMALPTLSLRSSTTLQEAAKHMAGQKKTDHASHHAVITDNTNQSIIGVLSALDVARSICGFVEAEASDTVKELLGDKIVADAMKPRAALPEISEESTLAQAFRDMFASRQNCIVVVEAKEEMEPSPKRMKGSRTDPKRIKGVITLRDVLRAFAEHMSGETTVMRWLRGLDASIEPRTISQSMTLAEAAEIMASNTLHHLLVLDPESMEVDGVLSSLDLVSAIAHV